MKVAIIEIPYRMRLAIPPDQLGALTHCALVSSEGYGLDEKFTVVDPKSKIEIKLVDDSEIAPFEREPMEVTGTQNNKAETETIAIAPDPDHVGTLDDGKLPF